MRVRARTETPPISPAINFFIGPEVYHCTKVAHRPKTAAHQRNLMGFLAGSYFAEHAKGIGAFTRSRLAGWVRQRLAAGFFGSENTGRHASSTVELVIACRYFFYCAGVILENPSCAVYLDEPLYAFPTGQCEPERSAFALQPHVNVKERATGTLANGPFRQELHGVGVRRKFKFVAVRQFPNALLERAQLWTELIKVTLPLF